MARVSVAPRCCGPGLSGSGACGSVAYAGNRESVYAAYDPTRTRGDLRAAAENGCTGYADMRPTFLPQTNDRFDCDSTIA
jgi:hypothetical protein